MSLSARFSQTPEPRNENNADCVETDFQCFPQRRRFWILLFTPCTELFDKPRDHLVIAIFSAGVVREPVPYTINYAKVRSNPSFCDAQSFHHIVASCGVLQDARKETLAKLVRQARKPTCDQFFAVSLDQACSDQDDKPNILLLIDQIIKLRKRGSRFFSKVFRFPHLPEVAQSNTLGQTV